jgi:hypothetical protein
MFMGVRIVELEDESRRDYVSPVAFAMVHLGLGDRTHALEWSSGRTRSGVAGWPISR